MEEQGIPRARGANRRRGVIAGVIAGGLLSAAASQLPWRLDYNDQAKQAFVSYEMVTAGQWWHQHSPDGEMATKPPLCGWLSALVYAVTRSWPIAWHLPSAAAGLALLFLVRRTAAGAGDGAGELAALAFLLNHLTQRLFFMVRTDMVLALTVFAPVAMVLTHVRTGRPWRVSERAGYGLALLAGLMVKGPVGYAFIVPGLLAFAWLRRRDPARGQLPGWVEHVVPLVVFGAWVVGGCLWDNEFYRQVVQQEFGGRFTGVAAFRAWIASLGHYALHLLARCFPWGLALAGLLAWPSVRRAALRRRETLWLACAFCGGLVVMSLIPSKRPDRIYPLVPLLSVLVAALAGAIPAAHALARWRTRWLAVAAVALLAGHVAYAAIKAGRDYGAREHALVSFGRQARALANRADLPLAILKPVALHTGMVLYARDARVVDAGQAAREWAAGRTCALIVGASDLAWGQSALEGAAVALASDNTNSSEERHFLLTKRGRSSER